jgi:hypothetical protein
MDATDFFTYDLNLNFGQFPYKPLYSDDDLSVTIISYGLPTTVNRANEFNTLKFAI